MAKFLVPLFRGAIEGANMYVHTHALYIYICICICIYIYTYILIYICMYMYICIDSGRSAWCRVLACGAYGLT